MNRSKVSILKLAVLVLLMLAALIVIMERSEAVASAKAKIVAPSGPLVEQVDKNIKVLQGMPESQLFPAMRFMSVSLGVACNYCHVSKDGQLDTAADDKATKRTARTMIKMVQQANASAFHGNPQISCYTCHRGQPIPQRFPNLPVALRSAPPTGATPTPSASATPALPDVDEILTKYTAAIGGAAAIDKIKSAVVRGTVVNASGSSGTFESDQVVPDKGYDTMTTQRGTRVRVLNQREGWDKNAYGVNPLTGQQLQDVKLSLAMFGNLKLKDQFSKLEVAAREKIETHDVYVVLATRTDQKQERLYFDSETGLLLRRVAEMNTAIGVVPEETDFEDYRDVEAVKLPTTIRVSAVDSQNPTSTRKIDKVELNVPLDDSRFSKPN